MPTDEESDGFKFATMLIATLGTIIYASHTYFQSRAIDPNIYVTLVGLITALVIVSILFVTYIFVKGYSMEVQEPKKSEFKSYASFIYSITFDAGVMVFLVILGAFLLIIKGYSPLFLLYFSLIIFGYIFNFWGYLKSLLQKIFNFVRLKRIIVVLITFIILILWIPLYNPMLDLMQGNTRIDMNNIYYKNVEPIPVSIEILGWNTGLSIYLYNATSEINNITLKPEDVLNKVEVREYLVGNAYASGKYYFFINTTNMSEGYYRLVYFLSIDGHPVGGYKYGKSFYLLNKSEK